MADKNISMKVNYVSSGMGVSKVPLAVAGSGVIKATDDTLRITSVRPSIPTEVTPRQGTRGHLPRRVSHPGGICPVFAADRGER